jgi:hypothetical protein
MGPLDDCLQLRRRYAVEHHDFGRVEIEADFFRRPGARFQQQLPELGINRGFLHQDLDAAGNRSPIPARARRPPADNGRANSFSLLGPVASFSIGVS